MVRVTRDGRVLSVQGSPVSGLAEPRGGRAHRGQRERGLRAHDCRAQRRRHAGARQGDGELATGTSAATVWSNRDYAQRVWFLTPQGLRPGWSTYVQTSAGAYQHVIDAATGHGAVPALEHRRRQRRRLRLRQLPGRRQGRQAEGRQLLSSRGWLKQERHVPQGLERHGVRRTSTTTTRIQKREKTPVPGTKSGATVPAEEVRPEGVGLLPARASAPGTRTSPSSWRTNRNEATTNGFYLASNFHDYLAKPPIGFTPAAGNFSANGGDPVLLNALDGADTDDGMPDGNHIDNANMSTPPDGIPPTMQMYLFHAPGVRPTRYGDPFVPTSRFARRLRPVPRVHARPVQPARRRRQRATRRSTTSRRARWVRRGATTTRWTTWSPRASSRTPRSPGELLEGKYVAANQPLIRTMAIDCAVGAKKPRTALRLRPEDPGWLHLRRLPEHRRRRRGARQRRDLGPDALGPAHQARSPAWPTR